MGYDGSTGWHDGGGGGGGGTIGGAGTLNYVAKFTPDGTHIGDSLLFDDGTSVGLGTATPDASAQFDMTSTTQGFLAPRMTAAQRNAIGAPATGLFIYNTGTSLFNYFDGAVWQEIDSNATSEWLLDGNTNGAVKSIGTLDNFDFPFVTNNTERARILSSGEVGIGLPNPTTQLGVAATGFANVESGVVTMYNIGSGVNYLQTALVFESALNTNPSYITARIYAMYDGTNVLDSRLTLQTLGGAGLFVDVLNIQDYCVWSNGKGGVSSNTVYGQHAMSQSATTGTQNSAFGKYALLNLTLGSNNTAVGYEALTLNLIGDNNTAVGFDALYTNTASNNTAVGYSALSHNTIGASNTAIGKGAMENSLVAIHHVAIGEGTLISSAGSYNIAIGSSALAVNGSGVSNIAIGYQSLDANTSGNYNVAIGTGSLGANIISSNNVAIGYGALSKNTANDNSAFGWNALTNNTTGTFNTAIGDQSLYTNTTGISNTTLGYQSGYSNNGRSNVFVGQSAGFAETTTNGATIIGSQWDNGYFNADGNIKIGTGVWTSLVHDINNNIAIGNQASRISHASNVIAIGGGANPWNAAGTRIVAIGTGAQGGNNWGVAYTASDVVAVGHNAMWSNKASFNVAVGSVSLYSTTTGQLNTAIGYHAGYTNSVGDGSVFLGAQAGYYETASNKLFIDNATRASEADGRLKALVYGVFNGTVQNQLLQVNGSLVIQPYLSVTEQTTGGTIGTTNATVGVVAQTIAIPLNKVMGLSVEVVYRKTAGAGVGTIGQGSRIKLDCVVQNIGGVLTLGTIQNTYTDIINAIVGVSATLGINGTNIEVQVTGVINDDITWNVVTKQNLVA